MVFVFPSNCCAWWGPNPCIIVEQLFGHGKQGINSLFCLCVSHGLGMVFSCFVFTLKVCITRPLPLPSLYSGLEMRTGGTKGSRIEISCWKRQLDEKININSNNINSVQEKGKISTWKFSLWNQIQSPPCYPHPEGSPFSHPQKIMWSSIELLPCPTHAPSSLWHKLALAWPEPGQHVFFSPY